MKRIVILTTVLLALPPLLAAPLFEDSAGAREQLLDPATAAALEKQVEVSVARRGA